MRQSRLNDSLIMQLREQGLTYEGIQEQLKSQGLKVSLNTIRTRIKEIYEDQQKEVPHSKNKKQKHISEEELIKLREDGLTYEEIVAHLNNKEIKVSIATVSRRISEICEKNKSETLRNKKSTKGQKRRNIPEEELIKLREQGFNYREIADYFEKQGIKVSYETVRQRIKEIERNKSKQRKDHKIDNAKLIEQILKLRESRKATDDQMNTIAKVYGVNLNGTRINKPLLDEDELDWEDR